MPKDPRDDIEKAGVPEDILDVVAVEKVFARNADPPTVDGIVGTLPVDRKVDNILHRQILGVGAAAPVESALSPFITILMNILKSQTFLRRLSTLLSLDFCRLWPTFESSRH